MSEPPASGAIPPELAQLVAGRDDSPLPSDAVVRFQVIGLTPGIANNYRFVLLADGSMLCAGNSADPPVDNQQRFNTELPDTPTSAISEEEVAEVRRLLAASPFAASPPYVGDEGVRGGSLAIVTARVDGTVHEVWYRNVDTELTDRLSSLHDDATQEPLDLDALLADLTDLPGGETP